VYATVVHAGPWPGCSPVLNLLTRTLKRTGKSGRDWPRNASSKHQSNFIIFNNFYPSFYVTGTDNNVHIGTINILDSSKKKCESSDVIQMLLCILTFLYVKIG
jgi:hypothetical protein